MQTMCVLKNKTETYQAAGDRLWSKQEIEEWVRFVRLEFYNRDMRCGAKALRERLEKLYHVKPLPSERTITRILARHGLTHGQNRHLPMIKARRSLPGVALSSGQARIL